MKLIPLTQGKFAQIDDEDFDLINTRKWFAVKSESTFYARTQLKCNDGKSRVIGMHRFLFGLEHFDKKLIDHKDRNGLNNQRRNLRHATRAQNAVNKKSTGGSLFLGVSVRNYRRYKLVGGGETIDHTKMYLAKIHVGGKSKFLGSFTDEKDAARAYNEAAKEHHGEFANLNIVN